MGPEDAMGAFGRWVIRAVTLRHDFIAVILGLFGASMKCSHCVWARLTWL